ncbi:lytic transglycosylase domain-containing protein [Myxococcota bacterium]|nr:lytic transglycosylase domain-containing protein [Myxococcota bacterium]
MLWIWLIFPLLNFGEPSPAPDAWDWGKRLSALRASIARPPVDADALWTSFSGAPSPVAEEAALMLVRTLPEPGRKRRFLQKAFSPLDGLATAAGPKEAARWLTEDTCTAPARLAVFRELAPLLPATDQSTAWETLWDVFPGHPQAFSFLLAAIDAAEAAGQKKDLARLRRVQFLFLPQTVAPELKRELLAALPCARRDLFIRIAYGMGAWDAALELIADCPDPLWEARTRYQLGEYEKALAVLQTLPEKQRPASLENRLASLALPATELAARYEEQFARDPSESARRRLLKTRLLAGQYDRVVTELEKDATPNYRFMRGLAAWMGKRTGMARSIWKTPSEGENLEDRLTRLYWLAVAGGPDELAATYNPAHPVHAYYLRTRWLARIRPRSVTVTRALSLLLPKSGFSGRQLAQLARKSQLPDPAALAFSLWSEDFTDRTESCLLDLMSMRSARFRTLLDLWKCPHLVDGHPDQCPFSTVSLAQLPGMLVAWTAQEGDWPGFLSASRAFLPQPHLREIREAARRFSIPASLLWAIMQTESSFYPRVISRAGAIGLFQVIVPTGTQISTGLKRLPFHPGMLLEPGTAVEFGAWYLRHLADLFDDHWPLVAAAYNAGPHQVRRWLKRPAAMATDAWVEEIPFEETRRYVKLVLGRTTLYARQIGDPPLVWPLSVPSR